MSCAGTGQGQPRSHAAGRNRSKQPLQLTLLLAVAAVERGTDAAAQLAPGLNPSSGELETGVPSSGGPSVLSPPSPGAFGLPNPLAPSAVLPTGVTPAETAPLTSPLGLPIPGTRINTLQLYNPDSPAVLIQPFISLGETFYDNVNYTATDRTKAAETSLVPGISFSADTPRFTGVGSGNIFGNVYVPTSYLDQISANFFGQGTGTIIPDRLFVDLASDITQASTTPGLGFVNPSLLPRTQQTLTFTNTVSPYLRQSFEGLVDTELRYRFASTNFAQNTAVTSTIPPFNTSLANGTLDEGTFTAATGPDFVRFDSRLVVDGSNFNSNSTTQNSQFSAFDDIEYFVRPNIAALAQAGYQNIRYPFASAATFAGATWLAGGRLGSAAAYGYVALEYGRIQGVYGVTGSADFQITPTLTFQANLQQGITSGGQSFQSSLVSATLSSTGSVVNQYTTFYNPGVVLNNNVYREYLYNFGLTEHLQRNTYSLFTYYINSQLLTPPTTAPTDSAGASLSWSCDIRPGLNGFTSAGYSRTTNVVTIFSPTPIGNTSTVTANIGLNHSFAHAITGSVLYTFSYQFNGGTIVNGRPGDILANVLQLYVTKAF